MFVWLPHDELQYGTWKYREEIDTDPSREKNQS